MKAEPQKEHHWLDKLVGEWTYETEAAMAPGEEPSKFKGTESVRSLGGLWVVAEGGGEMPGGGVARTLMTLGYDERKGHYVGSWVGSMMTHMWVYRGSLDATGNVLTLDTEGPDFSAEGKTLRYQDVIAFTSDDRRTLTARMLGDNGEWREFMQAHYRRNK